jgi:cytochrome P450
MHRDPGLWPDPDRFDPERWADPAEAKRLNKYLVSFGKDSRNCLGMKYVYVPPNPDYSASEFSLFML